MGRLRVRNNAKELREIPTMQTSKIQRKAKLH